MLPLLIVSISREISQHRIEKTSVQVLNNTELNDLFTSINPKGLFSIEIVNQYVVDLEYGWSDEVLHLPDLLRFYDLSSLKIQYYGDIITANVSGSLVLPSAVCMIGLRFGNLRSNLRFGCIFNATYSAVIDVFNHYRVHNGARDRILSFVGISEWPHPCAVIALSADAHISGEISWETHEGHNNDDFSLLVFADWSVKSESSSFITYDMELTGYDETINSQVAISRGYDTRGSTFWHCAECDETDDSLEDIYEKAYPKSFLYSKGFHRDPAWYDRQEELFKEIQTVSGMLYLRFIEDYVNLRVSCLSTNQPMMSLRFNPYQEVLDFLRVVSIRRI
jgi:hypothetical protein